MDKLFLNAYSAAKSRVLRGDFTDRLHSNYTVTCLLAILLILVSKQYSEGAIACWLPKQFTDSQENYIHQFCWINNTYYYPEQKDPDQFGNHSKYVIRYYQFILFILSGQIMLFYLPSLLWKSLVSDSGSYINKLLDSVDRAKVFSAECAKVEEPPKFPLNTVNQEQSELLNESIMSGISHQSSFEKKPLISNQFAVQFKNDFQTLKNKLNRSSSLKNKKASLDINEEAEGSINHGESYTAVVDMSKTIKNYQKKSSKLNLKKKLSKIIVKPIRGVKNLALYYFAMKIFNLTNVIVQLVGLRLVFGADFWRYGFDYMAKVMNNEDPLWMSKQFPIVTICDYYVHQNLRKLHMNSSQCLLAINVLIEKFYVFIWLWLYVLLFLTIMNIISWLLEVYSSSKIGFILKYLRIKEKMIESGHYQSRYFKSSSMKKNELATNEVIEASPVTKENVQFFHDEYLGNDGLVMMHIVKSVAGDMIFIELLNGLWIEYLRKKAN